MDSHFPSFHDGYLAGIQLTAGEATITLEGANGSRYELILSELQALLINDLREGNIICRLEVIQGSAPSLEVLERLFPPPHPNASAKYHAEYAESVQNKISMVAKGKATVVLIDPSYGANLVAFCSVVSLRVLAAS